MTAAFLSRMTAVSQSRLQKRGVITETWRIATAALGCVELCRAGGNEPSLVRRDRAYSCSTVENPYCSCRLQSNDSRFSVEITETPPT